tara:strand:- start:3022 stop:3534 length:513 start_codon:yes stop_codon:yes gene_type:complete
MSTPENFLDAPIPGESLVAEPKSRPWRRPSSISTVDEAAAVYAPMFQNKTTSKMLLGQIQSGVPLTSIADLLITANTMEGVHTLDVGILVSPILVETMITMAEMAEIDYVIGNERTDDEPGTKQDIINQVMKTLQEEEGAVEETITTEEMPVEPKKAPEQRGLMTRRSEI